MADGGAREQLERRVVVDVLAVEHAAVAVRGVLAEAHVGQEHELRIRPAQSPQRTLDDPVLVPGAGAVLVLLLGDPEEQKGAHAEPRRLLGLGDEILDRVPAHGGQVGVRLGRRPDEEREDEVLEIQACLAHERAQPVAAAQPAQARGRKGTHTNNLRAPSRASPPKTAPSATSQSPSRRTLPQGLRS